MRRLTFWTHMAAALSLLAGVSASATVIDRGLITHDVISGLEWLDLTVTTNLSYDQIALQLGQPGGLFEEFRHASVAEVQTLYGNAGIQNVPIRDDTSPQQIAAVRNLQNLLGETSTTVFFNNTTFLSTGISGDLVGPSSVAAAFLEVVDFNPGVLFADVANAGPSGVAPRNGAFSSVGHWLVKGQISPGFAEATPLLPTSSMAATHSFMDQDGMGMWFDPVAAEGFTYATTDGSNFTTVGLPVGTGDADGMFSVSDAINGTTVLSAGDIFDFPVAVDAFTITGIDPSVDGEDPIAFPTFLAFDMTSVSFTMTAIPVPEPGTLQLVLLGACFVGIRARPRPRLS